MLLGIAAGVGVSAGVKVWAKQIGVAECTLNLLLVREIGLSIRRWRRQLHMVLGERQPDAAPCRRFSRLEPRSVATFARAPGRSQSGHSDVQVLRQTMSFADVAAAVDTTTAHASDPPSIGP